MIVTREGGERRGGMEGGGVWLTGSGVRTQASLNLNAFVDSGGFEPQIDLKAIDWVWGSNPGQLEPK